MVVRRAPVFEPIAARSRERPRTGASPADLLPVRRAVVARSSLTAPDLVALQRTLGNRATTGVVGPPLQRNTVTVTESAPEPLHLVLKLRGDRTRTGSPDPDPDPGGSQTTLGEDDDPGRRPAHEDPGAPVWQGKGEQLGGDNVIRFNGKDYHYLKMSITRLTRLLDAITGTPEEMGQLGMVSEARRHLRRRIAREGAPQQPPPVHPEGTRAERRQPRRDEYAAYRALDAAWAPFAAVHGDGGVATSTETLRSAFEGAAAALRSAIVGKRCRQERPALEKRFAAIVTLYRDTQRARTGLKTGADKRSVTIADAHRAIDDQLSTPGLQGKKALKRELRALRDRDSGLQRTGLGILALRDGYDGLRTDTQDLADRAWGLAPQKGTSEATNWDTFYDKHDAHDQVVIDKPLRIAVPESNTAAITKGRDVIAAVKAGQPLAVAARTHANSVTIGGKGTTLQFHIRLSQGSTQIRMEAFQTIRAVRNPADPEAPVKNLKFIDFRQIQFGH